MLILVVSIVASGHVVLRKRDVRAATGWLALIWLVPAVGAILYLLLGINRIRRRARRLRKPLDYPKGPSVRTEEDVIQTTGAAHLAPLAHLVDNLNPRHPLLGGNDVELLSGGDEAFPSMLRAIRNATQSITMTTYIFDNDRAGHLFIEALQEAARRGVEIRVLIDAVGVRYSRRPVHRFLRGQRIRTHLFLPTLVPGYMRYLNLRSHRKILVVDGQVGFTGGMNIREGNLQKLSPAPRHPIMDVHVRIEGPAVTHMQEVFAEDWLFATGQKLLGDTYFPSIPPKGSVIVRGVPDGPDEHLGRTRMMLLCALSVARHHVRIVTPYFLPDSALTMALGVAAMRGVRVEIVLPENNNLWLVQWASQGLLPQVLERGCEVWLSQGHFDHSKLLVVDGVWCLVGSSNWDPRSLRLNFEFNMEIYNRDVARAIDAMIDRRLEGARRLRLEDLTERHLLLRLRDAFVRLMSPYL